MWPLREHLNATNMKKSNFDCVTSTLSLFLVSFLWLLSNRVTIFLWFCQWSSRLVGRGHRESFVESVCPYTWVWLQGGLPWCWYLRPLMVGQQRRYMQWRRVGRACCSQSRAVHFWSTRPNQEVALETRSSVCCVCSLCKNSLTFQKSWKSSFKGFLLAENLSVLIKTAPEMDSSSFVLCFCMIDTL